MTVSTCGRRFRPEKKTRDEHSTLAVVDKQTTNKGNKPRSSAGPECRFGATLGAHEFLGVSRRKRESRASKLNIDVDITAG